LQKQNLKREQTCERNPLTGNPERGDERGEHVCNGANGAECRTGTGSAGVRVLAPGTVVVVWTRMTTESDRCGADVAAGAWTPVVCLRAAVPRPRNPCRCAGQPRRAVARALAAIVRADGAPRRGPLRRGCQ